MGLIDLALIYMAIINVISIPSVIALKGHRRDPIGAVTAIYCVLSAILALVVLWNVWQRLHA